tara:strand:+ start:189 stop:401 length:213 start_codon:yes stop_codon:yes gene_type:complete
MTKVYDFLITFFLAIAVLLVVGMIINASLNLPDVHVSHLSGECVKVINYSDNDNYTCDNLPSKYQQVWVK